jgi:hypothetical protein
MGFVTSRRTECYQTVVELAGQEVAAFGANCSVCDEENIFVLEEITLNDGSRTNRIKPVEGHACDHNMHTGWNSYTNTITDKLLRYGLWVEFGVIDDSDENFILNPLKDEDRVR